jgi:hypothetical protein
MKDTKQRLFEVMERVNPDFVNEEGVINKVANVAKTGFNALNRGAQAVSNKVSPAFTSAEDLKHKEMMKTVGAMTQNFRLETFGDLMKMVNVLK